MIDGTSDPNPTQRNAKRNATHRNTTQHSTPMIDNRHIKQIDADW